MGLVAGASGAEVVVVAPFKVRTTLDLSATLERSLKSYDKERGSQGTMIHAYLIFVTGRLNAKKYIFYSYWGKFELFLGVKFGF